MASPLATASATGRRRGELREGTRRRLLEFGRRAFARKGHAGANLKEDILVPARVSVGSFYHQFHDKTELFLEILRQHSETFRGMIHEAHVPRDLCEPGDLARHSFTTVFRIAEENDDLFRIMTRERESDDPRVRAYLRENHRRWIESLADDYRRMGMVGTGNAGNDPAELAAELISAMTLGTILDYLDYPQEERPAMRERLIEGLVRFSLGGMIALVAAGGAAETRNDRS
jgi:AcrR family transcriptional regulator